MKLINKQMVRSILLSYLFLNAVLIGLYFSPITSYLTKPFWEAASLSLHGSAFVLCWLKYAKVRSEFFAWCSLCITALLIRDWHGFVIEGHPTLTSICYYVVLVGAFGSGLTKIDKIKQALSDQKILLLLWGTTFLLYFSSYIYDREMLKYIFTESVDPYQNYIEEASEATGAFLLFIAALLAKIKSR